MRIGDRIKALRNEIGMGQTDLADKIGVSKQTMYKYENNIVTNIPSDKIELIAKNLGTTPAALMGWTRVIQGVLLSSITIEESEIIRRIRALDSYGTKTVLDVLDNEFDRCMSQVREQESDIS